MAPPNQPNGAGASALRAAVPLIGAIDTRFAFQHFHRKPAVARLAAKALPSTLPATTMTSKAPLAVSLTECC